MSTTVILQSAPVPLQYRNGDGDEPQPILAGELGGGSSNRRGGREYEAENIKGRWLCVLGAFAFAMPSFGPSPFFLTIILIAQGQRRRS